MGHPGPFLNFFRAVFGDKDSTLSDDTLSPPMSVNSTTPRPSILGRELHRTGRRYALRWLRAAPSNSRCIMSNVGISTSKPTIVP